MDKKAFGRKSLNVQKCNQRNDRFVFPRDSFENIKTRHLLNNARHEPGKDLWYMKYTKQKKYIRTVNEHMGLSPIKCLNNDSYPNESYPQPWPCMPRKKSCLTSADSVLDLPSYRMAIFPELIDWSRDDILIAALDKLYYKYSWKTQSIVNKGITNSLVYCCKFDPSGELIAMGTAQGTVETHDTELAKKLAEKRCGCSDICSISAVEWSPTGNSYVSGCSRGTLTVRSRFSMLLTQRSVTDSCIVLLRISPDARYLAVVEVMANIIMILMWNSLEPYFILQNDWTVKCINWHPWRSALLGFSAITPNHFSTIALWDAPSAKKRHVILSPDQAYVDSLLFSHRTGEMVLSLYKPDEPNRKGGSRIVVLSDPHSVVDTAGDESNFTDRIKTMVFSPDGSKLATATNDEDLIIWNFLPEDERNRVRNSNKRRYSSLPSYLDIAHLGFSIR